jgi:hypothetical protein
MGSCPVISLPLKAISIGNELAPVLLIVVPPQPASIKAAADNHTKDKGFTARSNHCLVNSYS